VKSFTKQIEVCLAPSDELDLSMALLAIRPRIGFVDGVVFPTPSPLLRDSIDRCTTKSQVLLWEQSLFPELPVHLRPEGQFEGPNAGPVIQYLRPLFKGDRLASGRIAASGGIYPEPLDSANNAFIRDVWSTVRKLTTDVQCVDEEGRSSTRESRHSGRVTTPRSGCSNRRGASSLTPPTTFTSR
jgi:hypothetical protein